MKVTFKKITENLNQKRQRTLILALVIVCFVCLLILAFVKNQTQTPTTQMTSTNFPVNSSSSSVIKNAATSTTYKDSQNYFSISIPTNWRTESTSGTNTFIDPTSQQPVTQQIEISKLYLSDREGITIQVYQGVPVCPFKQSLDTTLAKLPASYDAATETWSIPTTTATVTVSVFYPGSNFNYHMQNTDSQRSTTEMENNKRFIMGILSTLALPNLSPYSCN
jgi:hypothetical protein